MSRLRPKRIPSGQASPEQFQLVRESVTKFRRSWGHVLAGCGRIRFVGGDYGTEAAVEREAQAWFLDALLCIPSCPIKSLQHHVWPQYVAAFGEPTGPYDLRALAENRARFQQELMRVDLGYDAFRSNSSIVLPPSTDSSRALREAAVCLVNWSHRFKLRGRVRWNTGADPEQSWKLSACPMLAAEATLWVWHTKPDRRRMLSEEPLRWQKLAELQVGGLNPFEFLAPIHLAQSAAGIGRLKCTNPADVSGKMEVLEWYVGREPETLFRERVRASFKQWLDDYVANKKQQAKSNGLMRAPEKRDVDHFIWLALFQVEGISAAAIANACSNVSLDTVRDALDRTARLIGLEVRPGKRGRLRRQMGD